MTRAVLAAAVLVTPAAASPTPHVAEPVVARLTEPQVMVLATDELEAMAFELAFSDLANQYDDVTSTAYEPVCWPQPAGRRWKCRYLVELTTRNGGIIWQDIGWLTLRGRLHGEPARIRVFR